MKPRNKIRRHVAGMLRSPEWLAQIPSAAFLQAPNPRTRTAKDRRNWWRFGRLCSAFGLTWALVTYLISAGILAVGAQALVAVSVAALLGLGTMAAYYKYLRETDELQRRIQLEGLALGFGAGIFWSVIGSMVARAGTTVPDHVSVLSIMMCVYAIGITVASHRYGANN